MLFSIFLKKDEYMKKLPHYIYIDYGYDSSYDDKIKLIKKNGFDGVFIFYNENNDDLVKKLKEANLEIEAIHLPFKNCNSLWIEGKDGDNYTREMINGILAANKYGIKNVIMHISSKTPPPINEIGFIRINKILEYAQKYQVNLALENLRRLDYLDAIYDNVNCQYLKFCFDSGHANAFTNNIKNFKFEKYKDKLACVHLHDNDGLNDLHKLPFDGNIDWKVLVEEFKKIDYNLPLTLEGVNKHQLDLNEEEYITRAKNVLEKINSYF